MVYDFTAGDTGSKIQARMIDSATGQLILPFNGIYTAALIVKPAGGTSVSRVMTNLTGTNDGIAEYTLTSAELAEGVLQTQVEITRIADSKVISELRIATWQVGPKLS